jgi:flagellar motor switch protein FliG
MQQRKVSPHTSQVLKQTPTERAAIVIGMLVSEDPFIAEQILRSLDPRVLARIFASLKKLPALDGDTVDQVLGEFLDLVRSSKGASSANSNSNREAILNRLEQKLLSNRPRGAAANHSGQQRSNRERDDNSVYLSEINTSRQIQSLQQLLESIDAEILLDFANKESLPAVCLALSMAPSETAANVLRRTKTERATELILGISQLNEVTDVAIDTLIESIEALQAQHRRTVRLGGFENGTARVVSLLSALEPSKREALIERLATMPEAAPQQLAASVRKSLVTMQHLAKLLPRDLSLVLAQTRDGALALALVNQPEPIIQKLLAALSTRRRECVQEELLQLDKQRGRIRLADVVSAQEGLVNTAHQLKESNKIVFPWDEQMI